LRKPSLKAVSVGNLVVGGSGKTPLVIALAKELSKSKKVAIVTKGYKRQRKGNFVVGLWGEILVGVRDSGDEAMLMAKELPQAVVIVANNRFEGIELAKKHNAEVVILDDAFHTCMEKFEILIDKKPKNRLCLPAGAYRLPRWFLKKADKVLEEGRDFKRRVSITNPTPKMVCLSAIANPTRLKEFLPKGVKCYSFLDHHFFTPSELKLIWEREKPTSFLVTSKDAVKLEEFGYPLSILKLELEFKEESFKELIQEVERYLGVE